MDASPEKSQTTQETIPRTYEAQMKESQKMHASVLYSKENQTLMGENNGTNRAARIEEVIIQSLPYLELHLICNHQTQALLLMPSSAYWQESDMDASSEALPESC